MKPLKNNTMHKMTDHNGDFNKMGKRIELFYTISDFESFVNRTDIKIIQVDVKGVEISHTFQQGFFAVVFYEQHFDKKITTNHIGDVNEMIPYQKALQLIDKFEGHSFMDIDSRISAFSCAKQCALIAVDEIINNNKKIPGNEKGLHTDINTDYWNEVKKELVKI
jgi:hypothetical protein